MFDHEGLITRWRNQPELYGAVKYGVVVKPITPGTNEPYWRCIGVYHLRPEENRGGQNVFCAVRGEAGARVRMAEIAIDNNGIRTRAVCDKPAGEPDTNAIMFFNDTLSLRVDYAGMRSDIVTGFHTRHPDEPGPHGERWNSVGHHSFFVAWQMAFGPVVPVPQPDPEPEPPPPLPAEFKNIVVWKFFTKEGWVPIFQADADLGLAWETYRDEKARGTRYVVIMARLAS